MSEHTQNYLFICAANKNRSRAAEKICSQLAQKHGEQIQCESAGVDQLADRPLTRQMAERADRIFVMEEYMQDILENEFHQPAEKIVCFDIPDIYPLQDPRLESILTQKITPYI